MNMFIYIQQVAGLVLVQVICSLNAATILNTVLYFGKVLFIIQFFGKNPDISKDGGASKGKVILALWVVGGLGLSSDGSHSVVFLGKTGGVLRYISDGDVQSPFWGLKFTI